MNINFKGSTVTSIFLTKSTWTLSSEFMDNVQSLLGLGGHCPWTLSSLPGHPWLCSGCPWTMSRLPTESMDSVHWVHGQCPLNLWTLSSLAGLTGLCPWTHWTLPRVSMDIVQTVHWVHGKCPLSPWTISRESTESMDFLQTFMMVLAFLPVMCQGQKWNSIVSVPDYFCFMYFGKLERFFTITSEHGCFQRKTKHWKTSLLLC